MIAIKLAEECDHNAKYESSNVGFIIAQLLKIIEQLEKEKSCKDF
jgi:hypothetical protein